MTQEDHRPFASIRFLEHYEGVFRKVRVDDPWPTCISEIHGFWPTHCRLDGELLRINCSNGVAVYREEGSDARYWRGVLVETSGENPAE